MSTHRLRCSITTCFSQCSQMATALLSWVLLAGSPTSCDGTRAGRMLLMEGIFLLQSQPLSTCLGLECSFSFMFNAALRFGGNSIAKS